MKKISNIAALFVCIFPIVLSCSGKAYSPKNHGRLPNLQTIQDTQKPKSTSEEIINKGIAALDGYYSSTSLNKDATIETLKSINWAEFTEQLTTHSHNALINNYHVEAQKLLRINRDLFQSMAPELQIEEEHKLKLITCAISAAVDAIELYKRKINENKPMDELLPPSEILEANANEAISKIPKFIYDFYINDANNRFTEFYRIKKLNADKKTLQSTIDSIEQYNQIKRTFGYHSIEAFQLRQPIRRLIQRIPDSIRSTNPEANALIEQFTKNNSSLKH